MSAKTLVDLDQRTTLDPDEGTDRDVTVDSERPRRGGRWRIEGGGLFAAATLAGLVLRLPMIFGTAGELNSDEAFMGLIAKEFSHGNWLWIFPGQHYEGTLEALPVALLTPLFGASAGLLKFVSVACWFGAAILADLAGRRLVWTRPGVVFALLWLWSGSMAFLSTRALVGYGSGIVLAALGYWGWSRGVDRRQSWWWMVVGGVGFGAAVWQQPSFLGTAVVFGLGTLLVAEGRSLLRLGGLAAGMLLGIAPWLAYNLANDWAGLEAPPSAESTTYLGRIEAITTGLLPRSVGAVMREGTWTLGVALGILTLLALLAVYGWVAISSWSRHPAMRPVLVLPIVNVAVVATFGTSYFVIDARYAVSFIPAFAVIVGVGVTQAAERWGSSIAGWAVAGLAAVMLVAPAYRQGHFAAGVPNADAAQVISVIEGRGLRCALGDYWVAERLDYLADGEVDASAEAPWVVRLPEKEADIADEPGRFARVAPIRGTVDQGYQAMPTDEWERVEVAGVAVYLPRDPAPEVPGGRC